MISYFPKEEQAIRNYMNLVNHISKKSLSYYSNKALPGLLGYMAYPFMSKPFLEYAGRSTRDVLTELGCSIELMGVLTGQWGDYGLPPSQSSFGVQAMVARHYSEGGNYPVGGSRMIAETVIPGIQSRGSKVVLSTGVEEILTHKGKAFGVRLENGDEIKACLLYTSPSPRD